MKLKNLAVRYMLKEGGQRGLEGSSLARQERAEVALPQCRRPKRRVQWKRDVVRGELQECQGASHGLEAAIDFRSRNSKSRQCIGQ